MDVAHGRFNLRVSGELLKSFTFMSMPARFSEERMLERVQTRIRVQAASLHDGTLLIAVAWKGCPAPR